MRRTLLLSAAVAAAVLVCDLGAQAAPERCTVIADTVVGPTPRQVRDRTEVRDQIQAVLRAHGQPVGGLLMVDMDSTRRGKVLFMEAEMADSTRRAAIAVVASYLAAMPEGRGYQALIRIDGEYPAMTPGRRHCRPELANADTMTSMMHAVLERHPEAGTHDRAVPKRATVRMVVTREGHVALVEVERPTGDAFIDANVENIARRLRFRPATLDGEPFDARLRFNLTFNVR